MPFVVVSSPKGGVGKTTLSANLAVAMRQLGWRVIAIDFDPQNALYFHFAPDEIAAAGIARAVCAGQDWRGLRVPTPAGVELIAFGRCTPEQRLRTKELVSPALLSQRIAELAPGPRDLVIADTAPGDGRIQAHLDAVADVGLTVFLADAGSMVLLPTYRDGLFLRRWDLGEPLRFGVLNQIDPRRRLSRDIADFIDRHQAERFVGSIRYDEAMAEAAACATTLIENSAEERGAAGDLREVARRLDALLR